MTNDTQIHKAKEKTKGSGSDKLHKPEENVVNKVDAVYEHIPWAAARRTECDQGRKQTPPDQIYDKVVLKGCEVKGQYEGRQ